MTDAQSLDPQLGALEARLAMEESLADAVEAAASAAAASASGLALHHASFHECAAELAGLVDDYREFRLAAHATVRATKASSETKLLRLRVDGRRLDDGDFAEPLVMPPASNSSAVMRATRDVDAVARIRRFADRAVQRFDLLRPTCAKEARTAHPPVHDASETFNIQLLLDTPDAVEDCLVAWDFMSAFRGSSFLPNERADDKGLKVEMLPACRLDTFCNALKANHTELQKRPRESNPFRFVASLHVSLIKLLLQDPATDNWWPLPKRNLGARWWERENHAALLGISQEQLDQDSLVAAGLPRSTPKPATPIQGGFQPKQYPNPPTDAGYSVTQHWPQNSLHPPPFRPVQSVQPGTFHHQSVQPGTFCHQPAYPRPPAPQPGQQYWDRGLPGGAPTHNSGEMPPPAGFDAVRHAAQLIQAGSQVPIVRSLPRFLARLTFVFFAGTPVSRCGGDGCVLRAPSRTVVGRAAPARPAPGDRFDRAVQASAAILLAATCDAKPCRLPRCASGRAGWRCWCCCEWRSQWNPVAFDWPQRRVHRAGRGRRRASAARRTRTHGPRTRGDATSRG